MSREQLAAILFGAGLGVIWAAFQWPDEQRVLEAHNRLLRQTLAEEDDFMRYTTLGPEASS